MVQEFVVYFQSSCMYVYDKISLIISTKVVRKVKNVLPYKDIY